MSQPKNEKVYLCRKMRRYASVAKCEGLQMRVVSRCCKMRSICLIRKMKRVSQPPSGKGYISAAKIERYVSAQMTKICLNCKMRRYVLVLNEKVAQSQMRMLCLARKMRRVRLSRQIRRSLNREMRKLCSFKFHTNIHLFLSFLVFHFELRFGMNHRRIRRQLIN